MHYTDFESRWLKSGGAERTNYGLFLQDIYDLLGVPRPDPTADSPAQDAYVLERAVTFEDGGKQTTGRIDLYKRGCFVLETKQGTTTSDEKAQQILAVRSIVQRVGGEALSTAQVAAHFRRTKANKVQPLLDTLAMTSLVRHLEPEDTYAA